ncbi:MAG: hypothetical protein ACHQ1F_10725 [Spirochaetia bacterium]
MIRLRPLLPWKFRLEQSDYTLTPDETSHLLVEAFLSIANRRDEKSIDFLLEAIQYSNPINRYALMGLLISSIFLVILYSDATGMYWMTAYLVPALCVLFLCYAVFDSMAISDARRSGRELPAIGDETMKAVWEKVLMNRRTGGWVLVIAGIVGILRIFSEPLTIWTRTVLAINFPVMGLVIPVILLVLGILLLQRGRK